MSRATRVLYIGGWGRSGSTLLDRVLGQVPGLCSVGELREIWLRGCTENRPCGCGSPFLQCEFWTEVGRQAFGGWASLDLPSIMKLRYSLDRGWALPRLLSPFASSSAKAGIASYGEALTSLYAAIRTVSGCDVVVDSGKLPSHALLLRRLHGIDVRLVHLVRDSRGVAFSWQKQVKNPVTSGAPEDMEVYGPASASLRYDLYNGLTRVVGRMGVPYLRLRYEDFVRDPRGVLDRILDHAGVSVGAERLAFLAGDRVRLQPNHTVDGNPMRFSVGGVTLRVDDEWKRKMAGADRLWVTVMTAPMLLAYGYPLRGPASLEGSHR
jgi:hypothetical protein